MDTLLDIASDRSIDPPGRLSPFPLPPGTSIVELHGSGAPRQQRVHLVDRDVHATFQ
jgi:hypothetical protein